MDNEGNYIISDFGIAHFSEKYPIQGLTKNGERLANFEFAAPEQINGGNVTYATDIYALFQIIYWYVFKETNRGTGGKHLYDVFQNPNAKYLDKLLYKGISNSPEDRYQNISEIRTALKNMQTDIKEINPFDDMHIFSQIIRSTVPEFFNGIAYTNNKNDINSLLLKIKSAKTNRPFEFNTGTSNNTIENIEILNNGNILINWHELNVSGMWGCLSNDTYNDILILETLPVQPYIINEQEEWAVAVIEDSYMIPIKEIESGFVRYNGKVVPTNELKIQERYIYPENLQERYYAVGAFAHCSIIQKNDCYLDALQKKENSTQDDVRNYRKQISRNKSKEIHMYL
jgi:serine/threonine-protein kinase